MTKIVVVFGEFLNIINETLHGSFSSVHEFS
jgi:hypothetical protein